MTTNTKRLRELSKNSATSWLGLTTSESEEFRSLILAACDELEAKWDQASFNGVKFPNGVVVVSPHCKLCGQKLVNESDLLVSQCNNSEACEKRRVAREVYPGDPLDALRELRDDLAHDEDRTFVNTANEVIDRWSNERTQHTAQLAERDARIAELERDLDKVIEGYKAATDRMNRFWREREAYRDKFRGLREAVDRMRGRATLCGSAASWVVAGLWNILDRFPVDEPSEPEQGEG